MLTVTLIDVEFPSSTAYFPSSSEDIQSTNSRRRLEKTFNIVVHSSFFLKFNKSLLLYVSRQCINCPVSVCILTVVANTNLTSFYS